MDDALLHGHPKWQILIKLATLIKSIIIVMGEPDTMVRQCPLAMEKWEELVIGPVQTMLGLVINTYQLTVSIPSNYVKKFLLLLNNTWHCGRKQFTVSKAHKLTGKLGHLAQRGDMDLPPSFPSACFYHVYVRPCIRNGPFLELALPVLVWVPVLERAGPCSRTGIAF
jgi:hypothetical protein